jgi:hypothetical protein
VALVADRRVSRREPKRIRKLFNIPPEHFWCQRCERWLNPAFYEREHPRHAAKYAHPTREPETLVGVVGLPYLEPPRDVETGP